MAKTEFQNEILPEADLKRLLKQVREGKEYCCAVAQNSDKKEAALLVDRRQKGKKLSKKLKGMKIVNPQTVRFGYAAAEGSTLLLKVNKTLQPAFIMQMRPIVRAAAGFTEILMLVNEALEDESEEDLPEEADGAPAPARAAPAAAAGATGDRAQPAAAPQPAPAPRPQPAAPAADPQPTAAATPDAASDDKARARLAALVKMVGPATLAYPSRKAELFQLASDAKNAVLANEDATARLAALETALRTLGKQGEASPAAAPAVSDENAKARLGKAEAIWLSARTQMNKDLASLKKAVVDAYADNATAQRAVRDSLDQFDAMFDWMDGRLEGKIGDALKAGSSDERRVLASEGAAIAADYYKAAKAHDRIKDLDDNPFDVPTRFGETIDKLLPQLEKAIAQVA